MLQGAEQVVPTDEFSLKSRMNKDEFFKITTGI